MKNITLYILLLLSQYTYSQTKNETQEWLIGKLTSGSTIGIYFTPSTDPIFNNRQMIRYENNTFKINGENLVISNTEVIFDTHTADEHGLMKRHETKCVYFVPINDIAILTCDILSLATLKTNSYSIVDYRNGVKNEGAENFLYFGYNQNYETSIIDRLNTAINHLKLFFPMKPKKEIF